MDTHCRIGWVKIPYRGRSDDDFSFRRSVDAALRPLEFVYAGAWSGFYWWRNKPLWWDQIDPI